MIYFFFVDVLMMLNGHLHLKWRSTKLSLLERSIFYQKMMIMIMARLLMEFKIDEQKKFNKIILYLGIWLHIHQHEDHLLHVYGHYDKG